MDILPDDWMKIYTNATVMSMPMVAPVMGRWKISFDYFLEPWSNLYGFIDNNTRLTVDEVIDLPRWYYSIGRTFSQQVDQDGHIGLAPDESNIYAKGIAHTSLFDYLGVAPGTIGNVEFPEGSDNFAVTPIKIAGESILTYFDIIRNYYANPQEGVMRIISNFSYADESTVYDDVKLRDMDALYAQTRYSSNPQVSMQFDGNMASHIDSFGTSTGLVGAFWTSLINDSYVHWDSPSQNIGRKVGLALRTYRMDLLRGIMSNDVGVTRSRVYVERTSDGDVGDVGEFSIDTLRFANKLQAFIDRIDISGGRFSDMIKTRWGVDPKLGVDRPIYLGSHSTWLSTIDVVATAAGQSGSGDSNNPNSQLGQQSGYIAGNLGGKKQRPISFKSNNYGTLMCCVSIVPDVVYSQGIELNMLKTKFADIYDPAFAQLGYQDVSRLEMSSLPAFYYDEDTRLIESRPIDTKEVVGKRVAWSEYLGSLNRAHGDFAYGGSLDYWVLNRPYVTKQSLSQSGAETMSNIYSNYGPFNATTYVQPELWNGVFADKSINADNFRLAVSFEIDAKRSIGKRLMPHL